MHAQLGAQRMHCVCVCAHVYVSVCACVWLRREGSGSLLAASVPTFYTVHVIVIGHDARL